MTTETQCRRKCPRCSELRLEAEFPEKLRGSGKARYCVYCRWFKANVYLLDPAPAKAEQHKRYHANLEDSRTKSRMKQRQYIAQNRDHVNAMKRASRARKPWLHRAEIAKRRVARKGLSAENSTAIRAFSAMVYGGKRVWCYWCGKIIPKRLRVIDHIVALSRGGKHTIHNLCASCVSCNGKKYTKSPEEVFGQGVLF